MKPKALLALVCTSLLVMLQPLFAADALTAQPPVELTGTCSVGKFDFIKIDSTRNRLLLAHTGNTSLDVIDVPTSKLIKSIPTGAAQGVAVDDKGGRYFVSVSKPPKMVVIDATKLEVIGEVPLPSPADLVAYHADSNRVFVCNDEKPELWIIDPEAKTIVTTLTLPGKGMEDLGFDAQGTSLFQCLKDSSELAQVDPKEGKVLAHWSSHTRGKAAWPGHGPGNRRGSRGGRNGQAGSRPGLATGQVIRFDRHRVES